MKAKQFADLRTRCGWTQWELAEFLGVSRSAVFHWERKTPIPKKVAAALRRAVKPIEAAQLALLKIQEKQAQSMPRYVAGHWEDPE